MAETDKRTVTLARRMMIYFFIIVFSSLVLGIEFFIDVQDRDFYRETTTRFHEPAPGTIDGVGETAGIDQIKKKVILLIAIQSFVTGVVLILFVKKITIPLGRMFTVTTRMAQGDFNNPIPVYFDDEIGKLGRFINDVVSDFGEVIGHTRIASRSCREHITAMRHALENGDRKAALAGMDRAFDEMEQLDDMVKNFNLARVDVPRSRS